jgi:hypothetical protein
MQKVGERELQNALTWSPYAIAKRSGIYILPADAYKFAVMLLSRCPPDRHCGCFILVRSFVF